MKKAKQFLALFLAICMVFAMSACKKETPPESKGTTPSGTLDSTNPNGTVPADIPKEKTVALILQAGGLGDEGWNDAAWSGLQEMMAKHHIGGVNVETATTADTELFIRELAEQGYGMIVCLDTSVVPLCAEVAVDYPESIFVFPAKIDMKANKGNIVWMWYSLNEMGFMAGVVAAFLATQGNEIVDYVDQRPGCKVGAIFGQESAGFFRYADGFEHGAKWVNPDCEVVYDFTAGFTDTANAQSIAENMIRNGCDVVWPCCGTAGFGALQACRLNRALGIGIDSDQDHVEPGYIVTSAMRVMEKDMVYLVEKWLDGTLEGSNDVFDLSTGSLGITDMSVISEYVTNEENFKRLKDLVAKAEDMIAKKELQPYDIAETYYTGTGEIKRFKEWWEENKDTNPNNIHEWNYKDQIIYD